VLKSLTRAEYSPQPIGHFALASEYYCHFTSPIRRYADLTIHRLLDAYFQASGAEHSRGPTARARGGRKGKLHLDEIPIYDDLVELGRHLSFTERRSEDAERELRQVKLLELLSGHVGEIFRGVVTGITNFGIFVQLSDWLIDGLIRYEDLMDDWWDVDERAGVVRGQRSGKKIGIGDVMKVQIVKVSVPRRELELAMAEHTARSGHHDSHNGKKHKHNREQHPPHRGKHKHRRRR
jgi:ribonuclease R